MGRKAAIAKLKAVYFKAAMDQKYAKKENAIIKETVDEFLARGGKITYVEPAIRVTNKDPDDVAVNVGMTEEELYDDKLSDSGFNYEEWK